MISPPPYKVKNCQWRHACWCGASDHVTSDKHCPNYQVDDEKFFKNIKGTNIYHDKKASKAAKFKKWKQYNALHFNRTSINQLPINNRKDDMNGNGYNKRQQRKCRLYLWNIQH